MWFFLALSSNTYHTIKSCTIVLATIYVRPNMCSNIYTRSLVNNCVLLVPIIYCFFNKEPCIKVGAHFRTHIFFVETCMMYHVWLTFFAVVHTVHIKNNKFDVNFTVHRMIYTDAYLTFSNKISNNTQIVWNSVYNQPIKEQHIYCIFYLFYTTYLFIVKIVNQISIVKWFN